MDHLANGISNGVRPEISKWGSEFCKEFVLRSLRCIPETVNRKGEKASMQLPSKDELFGYYQSVSSKVKQYVRNLTPLEQKVMDATSNEPWGPHGTVMAGRLPFSSSAT